MSNEQKPAVPGLSNAMFMLLGFAPTLLEMVFLFGMPMFMTINVVCSISGAWGLFSGSRQAILLCTASFFSLNCVVGLTVGCSGL